MAPITVTTTGIPRQTINDPLLINLLNRLKKFKFLASDQNNLIHFDGNNLVPHSSSIVTEFDGENITDKPPLNIEALVNEISHQKIWSFQEQVDLYEWITPLNAMDATLTYLMKTYPSLFLIAPSSIKNINIYESSKEKVDMGTSQNTQAESHLEAATLPFDVTNSVITILRFLSQLLRNATNKSVFNSVRELSDLLAASSDEIAYFALEALSNLSIPPLMHRLQALEMQQHNTALHSLPSNSEPHMRLMCLARGWGTRGSGLGLAACVMNDDSDARQASLPAHAGEVVFDFFDDKLLPSYSNNGNDDCPMTRSFESKTVNLHSSQLVHVHLTAKEIIKMQPDTYQAEKRRRMGSPNHGNTSSSKKSSYSYCTEFSSKENVTKSTSELFFLSLQNVGGRLRLPPSKAFLLLSQIRLARSFYWHKSRVDAVQARLRALLCILHSNPSQDALGCYFQAQPELCAEIVDLVRPTVAPSNDSSLLRWNRVVIPFNGNSRSTKGENSKKDISDDKHDYSASAIAAVAESKIIPYTIRTLAVEALTALVSRKDGAGGTITIMARQINVLGELGVGRGQFLGFLPALIRYSLVGLNAFLSHRGTDDNFSSIAKIKSEEKLDLDLGSVVCTNNQPLLRRKIQEEKALEFIDSVMTLASAVISAPTGTAALTDCGLIPALVSAVSLDPNTVCHHALSAKGEDFYVVCLLRYITSQAIQMLEGAIATHNSALAAFHDLQGVDLLVTRLHSEVEIIRKDDEYGTFSCIDVNYNHDPKNYFGKKIIEAQKFEEKSDEGNKIQKKSKMFISCQKSDSKYKRPLSAAHRVLLFSILNCLTVVFHHEDNSTSNQLSSFPSGGAQLRKPDFTRALIDIIDNVDRYGGVMVALTSTLLSDIMNADPQVVHHVHKSGLATSFLNMLKGGKRTDNDISSDWKEPNLPISSELVMAIPNVISALSLTQDGAIRVKDANPFLDFLSVFCTSKYAMPQTRCLLNEMAAIVGTGLDEIMRHVPSFKPIIMEAMVNVMHRVIHLGTCLVTKEINMNFPTVSSSRSKDDVNIYKYYKVEDDRTCFIQYAYSIGQILEQILHTEEHGNPFIEAGGIEAIIEIHTLLVPGGRLLLTHVSCQSSPSIANLTHTATSNAFAVVIKNASLHSDPHNIVTKLIKGVDNQLDHVRRSIADLRESSGAVRLMPNISYSSNEKQVDKNSMDINVTGVLKGIPMTALHLLEYSETSFSVIKSLSSLLRDILNIEWLTNVFSSILRVTYQRSNDMGLGIRAKEREWLKEISSEDFESLFKKLSVLHLSAMYEVCRIRTEEGYEKRELERLKPPTKSDCYPALYRLRIVCTEGAVVRNGIEIDSCLCVGSLEMGEVVDAFDRCINTSGVMRYRTRRGWISEQTRGHGRETIAEVILLRGVCKKALELSNTNGKKRQECGIPDLCHISASILARLQSSQTGISSCLSRALDTGLRSLQVTSLSFQNDSIVSYIRRLVNMISKSLLTVFNLIVTPDLCDNMETARCGTLCRSGICMYIANMLNLIHNCLYEEKKERKVLNLLLLIHLLYADGFSDGLKQPKMEKDENYHNNHEIPKVGFLGGIRFVVKHGLSDLSTTIQNSSSNGIYTRQRMSRSVAASMPAAIELLRKLASRTLLVDSPLVAILKKIKVSDFETLLEKNYITSKDEEKKYDIIYNPLRFSRALYCDISSIVIEFWNDPRLTSGPAHVINPILLLVGEIIGSLEESVKQKATEESIKKSLESRGSSSYRFDDNTSELNNLNFNRIFSATNSFLGRAQPRNVRSHNENITTVQPLSFQASEETVNLLMEMGFSREHALEAVEMSESNRLEIAMEYALANPPSSTSLQTRRVSRESTRRIFSEPRRPSQQQNSSQENIDRISFAYYPVPEASEEDVANIPLPTNLNAVTNTSTNCVVNESGLTTEELIPTNEVKRTQAETEAESRSILRSDKYLKILKCDITNTVLNIIEGSTVVGDKIIRSIHCENILKINVGTDTFESESLTVVMCSFLLDICEKYPSEKYIIVMETLQRLKSHLHFEVKESNCTIIDDREHSISCLCHASVIFLRALPCTRPILLQYDLLGCLIQCLRNFATTKCELNGVNSIWPRWIAPSLLLLDAMAQPTYISLEGLENEIKKSINKIKDTRSVGKGGEFSRVCAEHRRQRFVLSKVAKRIHSAINSVQLTSKDEMVGEEHSVRKDGLLSTFREQNKPAKTNADSTLRKSEEISSFTKFPTFLPLMTQDTAECSLLLCLQLLRYPQNRLDYFFNVKNSLSRIPPGVTHAILLLLTRILRSHKIAHQCLKMGGAELLLSLKSSSRFRGHVGLVTVALRRMLEDETTLQMSMETEIRSSVTKLNKKQSFISETRQPQVNLHAFVQAVAHLICRDPIVFLKAAATSVQVQRLSRDGGKSTIPSRVILLSNEDRLKNTKAIIDHFKSSHSAVNHLNISCDGGNSNQCSQPVGINISQKSGVLSIQTTQRRGKQYQKLKSLHSLKEVRTKSSSRHGITKKLTKRDRQDNNKKKILILQGSPANHIITLLLSDLLKITGTQRGYISYIHAGFLSVVGYLEIIANLVLAVPACAAAIHRYQLQGRKETISPIRSILSLQSIPFNHLPLQKNVVSYLLHILLPQPRVYQSMSHDLYINESDMNEGEKSGLQKRRDALMKAKISQATARLLVALVARSGEGRRRVISDLASALNGEYGESFLSVSPLCISNHFHDENNEMWALQSWGELCIGLAAPRSSGVNQDSNSSLSFEVVKVMLECGMAHSLMNGIRRVILYHPMASNTAGAILRPLEVFTRATVVDTVQEMVNRENEHVCEDTKSKDHSVINKSKVGGKKDSCDTSFVRRINLGPSSQSESAFADDAMLEDGFDADTAEQNARRHARRHGYEHIAGEIAEENDDEATFLDGSIEIDGEDDDEYSIDEEVVNDSMSDNDDEDDSDDIDISDEEDENNINNDIVSDDNPYDTNGSEVLTDDVSHDGIESHDDIRVGEHLGEMVEDQALDWNEEEDNDFFEGNEDFEDGGDEMNISLVDGNVDGDWTTIEVGDINEFLMGGRRAFHVNRNRQNSRTRGFIIEAAEAMIGNILRAGDYQVETLADIEDTLGIRIMSQRGDSEMLSQSGDIARISSRQNMNRTFASDFNMNRHNLGPVMIVPFVNQNYTPENSPFSVIPGRWNSVNFMESVYCSPALGAGRMFYNIANANYTDEANSGELVELPSSIDTQLFPGGPAASAHPRTQPVPHPLLSGVNLPPCNSLMSITRRQHDLNQRERRSQYSSHIGYGVFSGSHRNVIRFNRTVSGHFLAPSRFIGFVNDVGSWTDDGQPLEISASEFSLAFEEAMEQTIFHELSSHSSTIIRNSGEIPTVGTTQNTTAMDEELNEENIPSETCGADIYVNENTVTSIPSRNCEVRRQRDSMSTGHEGIYSEGVTLGPTNCSSSDFEPAENALCSQFLSEGVLNYDLVNERVESEVNNNILSNTLTECINSVVNAETDENGNQALQVHQNSHLIETISNVPVNQVRLDPRDTHLTTNTNQNLLSENNTRCSEVRIFNTISCPPGVDDEVFHSLPHEMQQEVLDQHQVPSNSLVEVSSISGLDPEVLAALPVEMRQEVIEQEQHDRRMQHQNEVPADPSHAEEMDNASFVVSLAPDLREEILLTADNSFLSTLPPNIIAEAQLLRERASSHHRRNHEDASIFPSLIRSGTDQILREGSSHTNEIIQNRDVRLSGRKKSKIGKIRAECDRSSIICIPPIIEDECGKLITSNSMKTILKLMYLLSPVRPQRLLQKFLLNLFGNSEIRMAFLVTFVALLNDEPHNAINGISLLANIKKKEMPNHDVATMAIVSGFPPLSLIGTALDIEDTESYNLGNGVLRKRHVNGAAAAIAANLPVSARASSGSDTLPPVVARRLIGTISFLSKNSVRVALDFLSNFSYLGVMKEEKNNFIEENLKCFEKLLGLLAKPFYSQSSSNLEELLSMVECLCYPLSLISTADDNHIELTKKDIESAQTVGKEWMDVPRIIISPKRLHLLCSIMRMDSCNETCFVKVNIITKRLCKVEANRKCIIKELAAVAEALGADAICDLRSLSIRLNGAVKFHLDHLHIKQSVKGQLAATPSSAVTHSTSSSELKLLRVLQALHALCREIHIDCNENKKEGSRISTLGLTTLFRNINLDSLWDQLSSCLRVVSKLEGVEYLDEENEENSVIKANNDNMIETEQNPCGYKKLQNSVAGLLTRFLPIIEAFFVVNASSVGDVFESKCSDIILSNNSVEEKPNFVEASPTKSSVDVDMLVGSKRLIEFVIKNKVLLNAILRSNSSLLDKNLRSMVQVPRCRIFLDFDVKRQWFKSQVRRLRQHASRRHGSLRLNIRRHNVFEDAYHQLRLRNAEEVRGRLHITFRNEEGVDAGGLSREFFGILAKEIFNPNYALFMSTEDGCTFQPNPHSSINPDHLSYFRFVGRIVGKAVVDGFLLDAHFTRSLYKHMLGIKPIHHDMQAIDPDYYKNLKMILEYNLEDIGLELTFSTEVQSFGRSQTIELIPNGRNVKVTENNKEEYVSLICQHRMTTAIEKQIKAYLDGFYELVKPELISIFTAKELELLISGMPDIDIYDLRRNTIYHGYKQEDREIEWFWKILFSLSRSEKAAFLQFVTGSSKVPLAGFSELQGMRGVQKFSIHKAGGGSGALMSAHTCFNALDLPLYKSEEKMKEKLLYAIQEGSGGFLFA